jgi:hypothetical protein
MRCVMRCAKSCELRDAAARLDPHGCRRARDVT